MNLSEIKLKDKNLREGLELLTEISSSAALSKADKKNVNEFIDQMNEKLDNVKLKLGIIGEFNSGKSTLLNNLLGHKLSAVGDRPCTPVPIYIEFNKKSSLVVNFKKGKKKTVPISEYENYTDYDKAPKGIKSINIYIASDLLKKFNITLIDTPGINAIDDSHTKITESVLPEMNASILLIYSKQPGSKSTIEFLKNVSKDISKIFICVSKSDFLNEDQLNRISLELPKRISKATSLKINKVWPISFTEKGFTPETEDFFTNLKNYMESEYYNDLTKDLYQIMGEYSRKINELLENRLMLQEEVFFDYLKSKPTDYNKVTIDITNEATNILEEIFNLKILKGDTDKRINAFIKSVDGSLRANLNVGNLQFGMFEQRVTKKSQKTALKALNEKVFEFSESFHIKINSVINKLIIKIQEASKNSLSKINKALKNFDQKMIESLKKDEKVIEKAEIAQINRVLTYITPILIITIVSFFILDYSNIIIPIIAVVLNISIIIYLKVTAKSYLHRKIEEFASMKFKNLESFTLPEFSVETLSKLSVDSLSTNNFLVKNEWNIQMSSTRFGVEAFGPAGLLLGLGISAITYFFTPKASDTHKEMMDHINNQMNNFRKKTELEFKKMKLDLSEVVEAYVKTIPQNYESVLNKAFKLNANLLEKMNKKISLLKKYNGQLNNFEKKLISN